METASVPQAPETTGISSFGDISLMRTYYRMENADPFLVIQFCQNYGLIASEYRCPICTQPMRLASRADSSDKVCWRCTCHGRNTKRSVRCGTWFAKSNLPIPKILLMTCCWVNKSPMGFMSHQCEVSPPTISSWTSFCREICFEIILSRVNKLGGPRSVVEIDELKLGKCKVNRGKTVDGQWVFGGYERGTGHCFFAPVKNRTRETLLEVIANRILPGTTIMSAIWGAYHCLSDEAFYQLKVNNSLSYVDPDAKVPTNANEATWSAVKKSFRSTQKAENQFNSYFAEYLWLKSSIPPVEKMLLFFGMVAELYPPQVQDNPQPQLEQVEEEHDLLVPPFSFSP